MVSDRPVHADRGGGAGGVPADGDGEGESEVRVDVPGAHELHRAAHGHGCAARAAGAVVGEMGARPGARHDLDAEVEAGAVPGPADVHLVAIVIVDLEMPGRGARAASRGSELRGPGAGVALDAAAGRGRGPGWGCAG